jgi:hypothetical protein
LVEPEALKIGQMLDHMPGIADTAIRNHATYKAAFDFLFASGTTLSEEDLHEIIDGHKLQGRNRYLSRSRAKKQPVPKGVVLFDINKQERGIRKTVVDVNRAFKRFANAASTREVKALYDILTANGVVDKNGKIIDIGKLAENMERVFGYQIEYGDPSKEEYGAAGKKNNDMSPNSAQGKVMTLRLLDSSLQQTAYFQEKTKAGLEIFRTINVNAEGRQLFVYLGATEDYTHASNIKKGRTPSLGRELSGDMYLGKDMKATDITHEFGHQVNWHFGLDFAQNFLKFTNLGNENLSINRAYVVGEGSQDNTHGEILADYYMTDVYASDPNRSNKYYDAGGEIIAWNTDRYPLAGEVRDYFEMYLFWDWAELFR